MNWRRRWYLGLALVYGVILAVASLGLLGLYRASRDRLDEALGARLLAVAGSLAVTADADRIFNFTVGDSSAAVYLDLLQADFLQLAQRTDLAEITLTDPDGVVLATTSAGQKAGTPNGFWELDRAAVQQAAGGVPAVTGLNRLQATFQKSAYVPVLKEDSLAGGGFVVAVLTVSGNPDFFDALDRLRRGALLTGGAVVLLLTALGLVLNRLGLDLERYRAAAQRQENLAAMGRMTAGIAHEIRNPLGIIRGAGQHLQRVLDQAGLRDEVADFIPEEVDRLDAILSGYLAFGSGAPAAPEVFDPAAVVRRGTGLLEEELGRTGVRVGADLAEGLRVLGDPRRLQQVLLNLLLNARDAMPAGGPVSVTLARRGHQAELRVVDRGRGLEGTDRSRLFEPFHTTKEQGSGLGLAMSRRIIEDLGGALDLLPNRDGPGAQAVALLPLAPEPAAPANGKD